MSSGTENLILITGPGILRPSYCNYLDWLGCDARLITPGAWVPEHFSGLLLSGGGDVDPELYGGDPSECEGVDPERDEMEMRLLGLAVDRRVPVLGICRGAQVLNVFLGGKLFGHICGHSALGGDRRHNITLVRGTRLMDMFGVDSLEVNSAHHQAIKDLGRGLVISAKAEDGVIEAVELPGEHFVMGVQWHPERDKNEEGVLSPSSQRLREAFLREVFLFHNQ